MFYFSSTNHKIYLYLLITKGVFDIVDIENICGFIHNSPNKLNLIYYLSDWRFVFSKFSAKSMFESMWSSMTSSIQLAEECVKQEAANAMNNAQPFEGIELFAQTIDSSKLSYVFRKHNN